MLKQIALGLAAIFCAAAAHAQMYATLVLINGHVWTENPAQPETEAIAVYGNRILRVGTSEEVRRLAGLATKVIDLHDAALFRASMTRMCILSMAARDWQVCSFATLPRRQSFASALRSLPRRSRPARGLSMAGGTTNGGSLLCCRPIS
jgi:hypothetical protein